MIFTSQASRIWVDYGSGDHRHVVRLNSVDIEVDKELPRIGFHATTGNDSVPSFFFKEKKGR